MCGSETTDMVATAVTSDGSKIKWSSPSLKGNTYLEHMNFDAWVGYAGGCDLSGSVSSFQQRMWVRGPRTRTAVAASTCAEVKDRFPSSTNGVYTLTTASGTPREVFCDMETNGGGWTFVNEVGRSVTDIYDVFEETAGGYHQYEYQLHGMVYDEILVVRTQANWCNSWGSGTGNFIDSASMGVAVDKNWFHYYNGQYNPYALIKQVYGIRRPGGAVTCSSCWAAGSMIFNTDMTAEALTTDGRAIVWRPGTKRNAHLEFMNFDAFIGFAGGCNSLTGGKSGHSVFVRGSTAVSASSSARSCSEHLEANPDAHNGLYWVQPPGAAAPVRVFCDMLSGGWTHCGSVLGSGSGHVVDIGLVNNGDSLARETNQYSVDCSALIAKGSWLSYSTDPCVYCLHAV